MKILFILKVNYVKGTFFMNKCDEFLKQYYGILSFRDYTLLDRSVRTLEANATGAPGEIFPWSPLRGIRPSHGSAKAETNYPGVWNWDCAFHAMAVMKWDLELARDQIRIFLKIQQENGKFADVWRWNPNAPVPIFTGAAKPPVLPWAAWEIEEAEHQEEFLKNSYDGFVKNERFLCQKRGGNAYGLFHYDGDTVLPDKRKIWSAWESGWDNSVRFDNGAFNLFAIDLNCYMVLFYRVLQKMAQRLGNLSDALKWKNKESFLIEQIENRLWDEEEGCYCDFDFSEQKFKKTITPASFMPLFIRTSSSERAAKMADIAKKHFHPGWPTISYHDPAYTPNNYWRGPTWYNVAYFALKGLKEYGFNEIANSGREQLLQWASLTPEAIYEYYDSKTGTPLGVNHFGWSCTFIIKFLLDWNKSLVL